jgi:pSer/pThr/pTyr-binding forkhead associated (FHA) protein
VRCARCGCDNPPGQRFCNDCGDRLFDEPEKSDAGGIPPSFATRPTEGLVAVRQCQRCDRPALESECFCPNCGERLISQVLVAPPTPPLDAAAVMVQPAHSPAPSAIPEPPRVPRFANPEGAAIPAPLAAPGAEPPPACAPSASAAPSPKAELVAMPLTDGAVVTASPRHSADPAGRPGSGLPLLEPGSVYLVVVAPDGSPGRAYALADGQWDLGRSADTSIVLSSDPFVCPRHARLTASGGHFRMRDLGSTNGIYLRLRGPVVLEPGDHILTGLEILAFQPIAQAANGYGPAVSGGTTVLGSPMRPRYARLTEVTTEGVSRSLYVVGREETILGRELGDIVFPADPFMSRRHAILRRSASDGTFTLEDLGSSNGTFLRIRGQADLVVGDQFRIGQHLLRLDVDAGQAQPR